MKRGTAEHPKMMIFAESLEDVFPGAPFWIRCHLATAILDRLWEWASQFAPRGDIGRYPNTAIARGARFEASADLLISKLVAAGWVDEDQEHRLVIHDWSDHCETTVHTVLAKKRVRFVGGAVPRLDGLQSAERPKAAAFYANDADPQAQKNQHVTERQNPPESATAGHGGPESAMAGHGAEAEALANALAEAEESGVVSGVIPKNGNVRNGTPSAASASAKIEKPPNPRPPGRGGGAQPLGRLLGGSASSEVEDYATRIHQLVGESEEYRVWWGEVVGRMRETDGMRVVDEGFRYVRDCSDPATRRAKDLGELKNPGAYLAKKCRDWLHRNGKRLPPAPVKIAAQG